MTATATTKQHDGKTYGAVEMPKDPKPRSTDGKGLLFGWHPPGWFFLALFVLVYSGRREEEKEVVVVVVVVVLVGGGKHCP